jgi:hypothetical protein
MAAHRAAELFNQLESSPCANLGRVAKGCRTLLSVKLGNGWLSNCLMLAADDSWFRRPRRGSSTRPSAEREFEIGLDAGDCETGC